MQMITSKHLKWVYLGALLFIPIYFLGNIWSSGLMSFVSQVLLCLVIFVSIYIASDVVFK